MSEVTIIKCDGVGCENQVGVGQVAGKEVSALEVAEGTGWIRDEFDSDFCGACQERAKNLEDNKATSDDLAAFGELVGAEADKIEAKAEELGLEKPPKHPMAQFSQEEFDNLVETAVKKLQKELKKQKKPKEFIAEASRLLRDQALALREGA